ncbi:hypothetical protein ILUMI_23221, partial [Ignelater luminosus]
RLPQQVLSLILKRKSDSDPVVKIVPMKKYKHILRESHQTTGHGGRNKMLYNLKSRYLISTSVIVTEEDLDQFVKQQHNDTSATSENLPAIELINNNASTSEDPALTARTPVLLVASEGEAVDRRKSVLCCLWNGNYWSPFMRHF